MGYIEKYNKNSKIIGKSNNMFLVTNNQSATMYDSLEMVSLIDSNGKYLTEALPVDYFLRDEEVHWEIVDAKYGDYIKEKQIDYVTNGLIGLAIGDALGVPVEFMSREDVRKVHLEGMIGLEDNLPFESRWGHLITAGAWSDDTSMTVATMDSIIQNNGEIHYDDIMRRFVIWWNEGKYTSTGRSFGLGGVVSKALDQYQKGTDPLACGGVDYRDNGNGSLMRILPFSLYAIDSDMSEEETVEFINKASSITHGHDISKMGCFIYTEYLKYLMITKNPRLAYQHIIRINYNKYYSREAIEEYANLLMASFLYLDDSSIPEKNGYVVATLESAIHSMIFTDSFESAVLKAINLGYDTDTVGAVTGSLAGILYGYDNIPDKWLEKLKNIDYLTEIAEKYNMIIQNSSLFFKNAIK